MFADVKNLDKRGRSKKFYSSDLDNPVQVDLDESKKIEPFLANLSCVPPLRKVLRTPLAYR